MATDNRHNININIDNLDEWMRSTGYLFPSNELEIARFDKLYVDYDFKLKNSKIDVNNIINDNIKHTAIIEISHDKVIDEEIQDLRMAARKGENTIPSHIMEKIKKHNNENQ